MNTGQFEAFLRIARANGVQSFSIRAESGDTVSVAFEPRLEPADLGTGQDPLPGGWKSPALVSTWESAPDVLDRALAEDDAP